MFKKNPRITYELLPDGRVYIETILNEDTEKEAEFFASVLSGNYFDNTLQSISNFGKVKNRVLQSDEIINFILSSREPPRVNNRPIIECDRVFSSLQNRINNEAE